MAFVQHLSVRVPWHDSGWDGSICRDPLGNSSCVLLDKVGKERDDAVEVRFAGRPFADLPLALPACAAERGSFLSGTDHELVTKHPYRSSQALRAVEDTVVDLPAWSVHGIPFFWLNRDNLDQVRAERPVPGYDPNAEETALKALGWASPWVLHGDNQQAVIETFFQDVTDGQSLIFFYLKHAPFEGHPRRMLAGAALVDSVTLPARWRTSGPTPFPNHMWETVVRHTLRSDGTGGILLPLQALARLADTGVDVTRALAAAPETDREFSYATEHVPADMAVAALLEIKRAADAAVALGCSMPQESLNWLDEQLRIAWVRRGPAPGLPGVLSWLGFAHPTSAARILMGSVPVGEDPWPALTRTLDGHASPPEIAKLVTGTRRALWASLDPDQRQALRLLARFDLSPDQVRRVINRKTSIPIEIGELLADPYTLVTCTVDDGDPIAFETVDRGCFPDHQLAERHPLPVSELLDDPEDRRRLEAAMAAVLLRAQDDGHTLLPPEEMNERLGEINAVHPLCPSPALLKALALRPEDLDDYDKDFNWPQLCRTELHDGGAAYKLRSAAKRVQWIRDVVDALLKAPRHAVPSDLSGTLDAVLDAQEQAEESDQAEERRARKEKAAALQEIYSSPLTVLNGPAGTGKTTLIKALVQRPEIAAKGILLLAPTGKARVQLEHKVGHKAQTLAQFLSKSDHYDGDGRYVITHKAAPSAQYGTVVVDEASMLTEDMLAALLDAVIPAQRLVLVGDPRQLPPIGAGRPFVDLELALRESRTGTESRVARGWAELTVLRRQRSRDGDPERDDLALAHWFSGDPQSENADAVWQRLRLGQKMPTLRAVGWNGRPVAQVLDDVLREEFDVKQDDSGLSFGISYGATPRPWKNMVFPDFSNAAENCGTWQVLSPVRGRAHGTVELNRHMKRRYRQVALDSARKPGPQRRVPKPLGPERIVAGDKVVHTVNKRQWSPTAKRQGYVANGELGVVTGPVSSTRPPTWTEVEFSSQAGTRYVYRGGAGAEDGALLELAWALTVHKSQGSEFDTVVVVLPAGTAGLSRELLYTALTRQTERVVLCHEGPLEDLMDLTRATGSNTARRFTDLLGRPDPRRVTTPSGTDGGRVDARLVHVAVSGVMVRSKNEVILAGILEELAPGTWSYEQPLKGGDGRTIRPDFTIAAPSGRPVYWEHLGMLDRPAYAQHWEERRSWYAEQGILPESEGGGPHGVLVWTSDRDHDGGGGVNVPGWRAIAERVIGSPVVVRPPRAPAKKVAAPRRPS
ncbi:AAA family ATPase [Streptomyces sp. AP-93]|uniref:AAA family ATPase n=1 Tax=Streptomyces sp. AP-93 TaxID=2929048 RepID=UPI001FAF375A|nr:AAA family ATPase [Streptomyces sp. AP-93]MCJ0868958.1 ATP-dependent RecD-like DNA helicase [Streptomyces sp. AP-93]